MTAAVVQRAPGDHQATSVGGQHRRPHGMAPKGQRCSTRRPAMRSTTAVSVRSHSPYRVGRIATITARVPSGSAPDRFPNRQGWLRPTRADAVASGFGVARYQPEDSAICDAPGCGRRNRWNRPSASDRRRRPDRNRRGAGRAGLCCATGTDATVDATGAFGSIGLREGNRRAVGPGPLRGELPVTERCKRGGSACDELPRRGPLGSSRLRRVIGPRDCLAE